MVRTSMFHADLEPKLVLRNKEKIKNKKLVIYIYICVCVLGWGRGGDVMSDELMCHIIGQNIETSCGAQHTDVSVPNIIMYLPFSLLVWICKFKNYDFKIYDLKM
jgi:hypothetical protein